jgi:hypothetical protein
MSVLPKTDWSTFWKLLPIMLSVVHSLRQKAKELGKSEKNIAVRLILKAIRIVFYNNGILKAQYGGYNFKK